MFKFGAFLAHQTPDAWNAKKLLTNFWHRGRQLLDDALQGEARGGYRRPWKNVGARVEPKAVYSCTKPVVGAIHKSSNLQKLGTAWNDIFHGYLSRNVANGLASRASRGSVFRGLVVASARSRGRYDGLTQKVVSYGFITFGLAAGSQTSFARNGDEDGVDDICNDIRGMFAPKKYDIDSGDVLEQSLNKVRVADIQFGDIVTCDGNSAVFDAHLGAPAFCDGSNESCETDVTLLTEVPDIRDVCERDETDGPIASEGEVVVPCEPVDTLKQAVHNMEEQHSHLSGIHQDVLKRTRCLLSLLGADSSAAELNDNFVDLYAEEQFEEFEFVELESDDLEVVSTSDSSLDDVSLTLDELEEAVALAEQQYIEFVNLRQILYQQNSQLRALMADREAEEVLSTESDRDISDCEELYSSADTDCEIVHTDNVTVKVHLMPNCSADFMNRMLMKELIPAASHLVNFSSAGYLPRHFNIAKVYGGFVAGLHDIQSLDALRAVWPLMKTAQNGNAMCLVMRRYEFTLADFLASHNPGILESSLLLLQMLEAVVHMSKNGVCHRNLTSTNIFVQVFAGGNQLVVSDFGQCICGDGILPLHVPFLTNETFKGGSLLPPEIAGAQTFTFLNYNKADLWTTGAIAYEIFGGQNPFCTSSAARGLSATSYLEDDLPDLPQSVPWYLSNLVKLMLTRNASSRPDPLQVANALNIVLWAPKEWIASLQSGGSMPSLCEIRRWLVNLGATLYCREHLRLDGNNNSCQQLVADRLQEMFLSRASAEQLTDAMRLLWIDCRA